MDCDLLKGSVVIQMKKIKVPKYNPLSFTIEMQLDVYSCVSLLFDEPNPFIFAMDRKKSVYEN